MVRGTVPIVQNFYETKKLDGKEKPPSRSNPGAKYRNNLISKSTGAHSFGRLELFDECQCNDAIEGAFPLVSLSRSTMSKSATISR